MELRVSDICGIIDFSDLNCVIRWAVSGYNGATDGDRSAAVLAAPQGASFDSGASCPAPPEWCPPGSGGGPPTTDPIDNNDPTRPPDSGPPPADSVYRWAALGDSYAAAPGTRPQYGTPDDCYQGVGSYAVQLDENFPPRFENNVIDFRACSGHTTDKVRDIQVPAMQSGLSMVTLSIGGNDLFFGRILKACLFRPYWRGGQSCDEAIKQSALLLIDPEFEDRMIQTWNSIFDSYNNGFKLHPDALVYQQLYPDGGFFYPVCSIALNPASLPLT